MLKYCGRNLFIGNRLHRFNSPIRKAEMCGKWVAVLADRLFFHDATSFATGISSDFFVVGERIFYQSGGVFSIAGPYDEPRFEFVSPHRLVGATKAFFVLQAPDAFFLRVDAGREAFLCLGDGVENPGLSFGDAPRALFRGSGAPQRSARRLHRGLRDFCVEK